MTTRLTIRKDGRDVSDEIVLANRCGNPFGHAAATLRHEWEEWIGGARVPFAAEVGSVDCGHVVLTDAAQKAGYTYEITEEAARDGRD